MTTVELPPEPTPVVVRDVHPATVTWSVGEAPEVRKARVLLTRERLYVWEEHNRAPRLAWSLPYRSDGLVLPERGASKGKAWRVPTADGMVVVQPAGGCGCGSALKLAAVSRLLPGATSGRL